MNTVKSLRPVVLGTICSAALAITLACANAYAGERDAPPQRVVRYGDLNLNHNEGVRVLYQRLSAAARAVCESDFSIPQTLRGKSRECTRRALSDAIAKVDNVNLTAYHNARNGGQPATMQVAARP